MSIPVAAAFFAIRARIRACWPWPGALCGVVLFAALALFEPPAARSALDGTPDTPMVTALAFATSFLLWGVALDLLARFTRPSSPARGGR